MRFMVIVKATKESEAGLKLDEKMKKVMSEMGKFNEELVKAGVMLAGDGLKPSSAGARVQFVANKRIVTDGPFPETKELIAGFWIWKCKNLQEAIEWAKKAPHPHPGHDTHLEIRPFYEPEDFGAEMAKQERELLKKVKK